MEVTIKELVPELKQTIRRRLVPMVHSSPGIGKSAIAKQIAAEYSLKLIDLRLSQSDPTDLSGFPKIDTTIGKASYCPMETFPIEGDAIPVGCNGWLILLDELPSARPAVQAAA